MNSGIEQLRREITPDKLEAFKARHSTREVNKTFSILGKYELFAEMFSTDKAGKDKYVCPMILRDSVNRLDHLAVKNIEVLLEEGERNEYIALRRQVLSWVDKILMYEKHRKKVTGG